MSSSTSSWHSSVKMSDRSETIKLLKLVIQARSNNQTDLLLIDIIEQKMYNNAISLEDYVNIRNLSTKVISIIRELKSEYLKNSKTTLTNQEIAQTMSGEPATVESYTIADLNRMLHILNDTSDNSASNATPITSNVAPTVSTTLISTNSSNNDKHVTIIIDDDDDVEDGGFITSHANSDKPTSSTGHNVHEIGHNSDPTSLPMDVADTNEGDCEVMHIEEPAVKDPVKDASDKLRRGKLDILYTAYCIRAIPMNIYFIYMHVICFKASTQLRHRRMNMRITNITYLMCIDVQAFVESYGYKLNASYILPQKCTTLHPGLCVKDTVESLSFPLKEGSPDISAIKLQSLLSAQRSPTHTSTPSSKSQYYLPSELLTIKNREFTEHIEGAIKEQVIAKFCENLDPSKFEVKLLGGRFLDSSGNSVDTVVTDEPTAFEVANSLPNFEHFCGTICIQVS